MLQNCRLIRQIGKFCRRFGNETGGGGWPYLFLVLRVALIPCQYCFADPDVETLDWRAVCGRTARTVRREGRAGALPYPYRERLSSRRKPGSTMPCQRQTACGTTPELRLEPRLEPIECRDIAPETAVPHGAWIPAFAGITGVVVIPAKAGIHNALQVPGSVQHYSRAAIRADIRQRWYAFPRPADQAGSPFRKLRAKQRCSPRPSARYVRPCVRCWCWRCSVRGWRR